MSHENGVMSSIQKQRDNLSGSFRKRIRKKKNKHHENPVTRSLNCRSRRSQESNLIFDIKFLIIRVPGRESRKKSEISTPSIHDPHWILQSDSARENIQKTLRTFCPQHSFPCCRARCSFKGDLFSLQIHGNLQGIVTIHLCLSRFLVPLEIWPPNTAILPC